MKALSIQQPWAWLIVHGYKPVENRTWRCDHRGSLAIHAGKKVDAAGDQWVRDEFPEIPLPPLETLETGGIVGAVSMRGCVRAHTSPWFFGPYGFLFAEPTPLPFRAVRGQLGLFDIPNA